MILNWVNIRSMRWGGGLVALVGYDNPTSSGLGLRMSMHGESVFLLHVFLELFRQ